MSNGIKKLCIIGSGVMGAGIAALVANSSIEVILLDIISKEQDRNAVAKKAIENLQKQRPPALSYSDKINLITIGNLEDDLDLITDCDLVIEVIIEKLEIKHQLYKKILPYFKDSTIIASNTSTLPLKKLKETLPESVKKRFVITHFFNPPRYMELLELVIDSKIDPKIIDRLTEFLSKTLGKTIIKCNDTPGFIANRVGCFLLELVVRRAIESKLNPVIIDQIFTTYLKLPSTGIFGLYDLIGHDVMKLISNSLITSLPDSDNYHQIYLDIEVLNQMIKNKLIGCKGDGGFYRISLNEGKKIKEIIDFSDLSYKAIKKTDLEFKSLEDLLNSESIYGKFFNEILTKFYLYLTSLIPEVTDNIYDIDRAMQLGYSWKYGPFELLAYHVENGFERIINNANIMKLPLSNYLNRHLYKNIQKEKFYDAKNIIKDAEIVLENESAKFVIYKKQLVFVIKTKMNCLNSGIFNLLLKSIEIAESKGQNLYICPESPYFSAGADLKFILSCIDNNKFNDLETFLELGQKAMMRLKYSSINIISCAMGVALGGGCEILLHSNIIFANQELNAGLVEVGVGLIPSFGGLKEMFLRAKGNKDILVKNLENIVMQNKSNSADYFTHDYNMDNIHINMNKHNILEEALELKLNKKEIKQLEQITIPKVNLAQELNISNYNDFQKQILSKLQDIIDKHKQISEEELLSIEREIFLDLAKNSQTKEKLKLMLK